MRIEAWVLGRGVAVVGMGPRRAASGGAALAARLPPAAPVVVTGVCGGLAGRLRPGTVVVADRVCGPGLPERSLAGAEDLARAVHGRGLAVEVGQLWSAPTLVRGAERARLAADGALAVDMESAALLASLGDRPVAVARVVADTADRGVVRGGLVALAGLRRLRPALLAWVPAGS